MTLAEVRISARAWADTGGVLVRAARRALPDAVDAGRRRGLLHGLRTWRRLVRADLETLIAEGAAILEALLTGEVREKTK